MKKIWISLVGFLAIASLSAQEKPLPSLYGTGVWDADSLGNHRVVVSVDKAGEAVLATMNWRRRDLNPEEKNLIVVDAKTGKRVTNVARFTVNREKGEVVFQPQTVPGNYYIYYLTFYDKLTYSGSLLSCTSK